MTLGELIRKHRKARYMTQLDLAERIWVGQGTICKWEKDMQLPGIVEAFRLETAIKLPLKTMRKIIMRNDRGIR